MRLFPWFIASCFGVAVLASAQSNYLAAVGPPPLRFREPRPVTLVRLPPLPKDKRVPVVSAPPARTNVIEETLVSQSPPLVVASAPVTWTNEFAVTPEMLIETFRQRGHGSHTRETAIVSLHDFVPPSAGNKPSSTATYESP